MKSDDAAEPVEWNAKELRRSCNEWSSLASQMIEFLHQEVHCEDSAHWKPHLSQITKTIAHLRDRCVEESLCLGQWREDGLQPDEVHELVWAEADQLVQWLTRMMNI